MRQSTLDPRDLHAVDRMIMAGTPSEKSPVPTSEHGLDIPGTKIPTAAQLDVHERKFMPTSSTLPERRAHTAAVDEVRKVYGIPTSREAAKVAKVEAREKQAAGKTSSARARRNRTRTGLSVGS